MKTHLQSVISFSFFETAKKEQHGYPLNVNLLCSHYIFLYLAKVAELKKKKSIFTCHCETALYSAVDFDSLFFLDGEYVEDSVLFIYLCIFSSVQ